MTDFLLHQQQNHVLIITLNRANKHNAFNDVLLGQLQKLLDHAEENSDIRVIVIKAHGPHFSAGADLSWMQKMAQYSEDENLADAQILANVMYSIHRSSKPTIAMVQGAAIGGGAGLVAACDIAIASEEAFFAFTEVKLGLIPAVISPFVIQAIGPRAANWLFMSAEKIDARQALDLQLIQHCVPSSQLEPFTLDYAQKISEQAPLAVQACKSLVHQVSTHPINETLMQFTASLIAKKRVSREGQIGLHAFLNKEKPTWV